MRFVKEEDGYQYYVFRPTLTRQYYNKKEEWTPHRGGLSHALHMMLYYLRGGYEVLYMMDGDNIAAYVAYARCGRTVIEGTTREDIFTVFVTTHPDYRRRGLATKLIHELLHGVGLSYRDAYKTIKDHNLGSIRAAAANGYEVQYAAKRVGLWKCITRDAAGETAGDWKLYRVRK